MTMKPTSKLLGKVKDWDSRGLPRPAFLVCSLCKKPTTWDQCFVQQHLSINDDIGLVPDHVEVFCSENCAFEKIYVNTED